MAWIAHEQAQREADAAWGDVLRKRAARLAERQRQIATEDRRTDGKRRKKQKRRKLGWFNSDGSVNHKLYMQSADWSERKRRYFSTHKRICKRCGANERIQLHHRTYENLGLEPDEDLEPLCENCHNHHHGYY